MGSTNAGKTDAARRRINRRLPLSGAGDAFTAAVIYSYLKGFGIDRTIDYALAAGAVAVSAATTINPEISPELIEKIIIERG